MSHISSQILSQSRRLFSTSRACLKPTLSANYKSKDIWDDRLQCSLLGDQRLIKSINTKILSDIELNNLEVDVFINIAAPRKDDLAQLQEAAKTLRTFRKSLCAHTLLPSTSHAICRLFLDSEKLPSLVRMLERRVEFGIFPDQFALNLLFDRALELEQYAIACRIGALVMLQEEFGLNPLGDSLTLYSIAKYVESRTDFSDWTNEVSAPDQILNLPQERDQDASQNLDQRGEAGEDGKSIDQEDEKGYEDDEADDAEYIRVPFLRNPYHDNHFDLANPRQVCGKTLSMLAGELIKRGETVMGAESRVLGEILIGHWTSADEALSACVQSNINVGEPFVNSVMFYLDNLNHLAEAPDDRTRQSLMNKLNKLPRGRMSLSDEANAMFARLKGRQETGDLDKFRRDLKRWSDARVAAERGIEDLACKKKLIEEIRAKKEDLKH